jgi:L-rhamnonate dehydratase
VELFIDANCNLDLYHATQLAEMIKPLGIGFFEEPLTQNDVRQMASCAALTGMPLACGQNEGLLVRFRDLLLHQSVDYLQPNVAIGGGITQCLKIAGWRRVQRADGERRRLGFHNMHLHAGVSNGGMVEHHYLAVELCRQHLSRSARAGSGFHAAGEARSRLRAGPRCDPRDRQAAVVARQRQRLMTG